MAEAAEAAPETDHPAPGEPLIDDAVAKSAARKLVSGAINAAKASALDEGLAASLRSKPVGLLLPACRARSPSSAA